MKNVNYKLKVTHKKNLISFHIFCFTTIIFALICVLFTNNNRSENIIYQYNHRMTNTNGKHDMSYAHQYSRKIITNIKYIKSSNLELDVREDRNGKFFIYHDYNFFRRKLSNVKVWNFDIKDSKKFNVMSLKQWINKYGQYINKVMIEFKYDWRFLNNNKFLKKEQRELVSLLNPIKQKVIINSFNMAHLKYFKNEGFKVYLDLNYQNLMKNITIYKKNLDGIFLNVNKMLLTKVKNKVVSKDPDFNKFIKVWKKGLFLWNIKEGLLSNKSNDYDSEYLSTRFLVENINKFKPVGIIINKSKHEYKFNEIIKENGMDYIDRLNVSEQRKRQILMDFLFGKNHEYYKNSDSFEKWKSDVLQRIK